MRVHEGAKWRLNYAQKGCAMQMRGVPLKILYYIRGSFNKNNNKRKIISMLIILPDMDQGMMF